MPTIEDVYLKFGSASEVVQLLELELGTLLFRSKAIEASLFENPSHDRALELSRLVNRKTLGQLIGSLSESDQSITDLQEVLSRAVSERNRLAHSFFREHNNRRNSEEGRIIMLEDLESIHETFRDACKAVMRLSGIDLDSVLMEEPPTEHLPL